MVTFVQDLLLKFVLRVMKQIATVSVIGDADKHSVQTGILDINSQRSLVTKLVH